MYNLFLMYWSNEIVPPDGDLFISSKLTALGKTTPPTLDKCFGESVKSGDD
jgi:hypothetical protein